MNTGSAPLPDIGKLSYNGVDFSTLFFCNVSARTVLDAAQRTIMYVEYTLTAEGFVTLNDDLGQFTIDASVALLRRLLNAPAGRLEYSGHGFGDPFVVNEPGPGFNLQGAPRRLLDVKWGPIPKTLEFIPLGAARSAKVVWTVTTCIPELTPRRPGEPMILQFNDAVSVTYNEDGYSSLRIAGTLEIAMTRPVQRDRNAPFSVDFLRRRLNENFYDLTRFKVTNRKIDISRDRRTMEWEYNLEELAPMTPPPGMLVANGSFKVKPERAGIGIVRWVATLSATYIVPKDLPRRLAWLAFAAMWGRRMHTAYIGRIGIDSIIADRPLNIIGAGEAAAQQYAAAVGRPERATQENLIPLYTRVVRAGESRVGIEAGNVFPTYFAINEGLYDDSRTISFEASWVYMSLLRTLLISSGIWRSTGMETGSVYQVAIQKISGDQSWLTNRVAGNAIIDVGS